MEVSGRLKKGSNHLGVTKRSPCTFYWQSYAGREPAMWRRIFVILVLLAVASAAWVYLERQGTVERTVVLPGLYPQVLAVDEQTGLTFIAGDLARPTRVGLAAASCPNHPQFGVPEDSGHDALTRLKREPATA